MRRSVSASDSLGRGDSNDDHFAVDPRFAAPPVLRIDFGPESERISYVVFIAVAKGVVKKMSASSTKTNGV